MKYLIVLGQNIVRFRKKNQLTQEDLAGLAEMDRSYLSEIENGHKNISISSLIRLAKALNTNAASLLNGVEDL